MKKPLFYLSFLLVILMFNCTSSQSKDPIPPHDTFKIPSKIIGEKRVINVWTPENYKNSTEKFPVLYMADGGIKEGFPHIANTISQLIQSKKISPIILVGIENTQRRRDLTGFTEVEEDKKIAPVVGGSEKFRAFIKEELFPQIEKRYRTSEKRGIIGESASGLFVTETLFLAPEMFDFYIAFDPSLWWNKYFLVRSAEENLKNLPTKKIKFWFAGSNTPDIAPHTKALADILKSANSANLIWKYSDEPNEKHNTIFRATKEKAIIWSLNDGEK